MPPQYVRPYVKTNKHDAADAEACYEAVQRPGMRFVPAKGEDQQAMLVLHRVREQLLKQRCEVPAGAEILRIADRGHHGCGDHRSNPGYGRETFASGTIAGGLDQAAVELRRSPLEIAQVGNQALQQLACERWDASVLNVSDHSQRPRGTAPCRAPTCA